MTHCWQCGHELIWGGDHDFEDCGLDGEGIVSNLSCPECPTFVLSHTSVEVGDIKPLSDEYKGEERRWAEGYRLGRNQMENFYERKIEELKSEITDLQCAISGGHP